MGHNVNRRDFLKTVAAGTLTFGLSGCSNLFHGKDSPNILFLISDDMNDWIGCLGGHPDAITPNLDRLAKRSVLFEQAHCSAPICNPSRASFLSGLNPSTTGIYGNRQALRMSSVGFDAVTLPRYFSQNGYFSWGVGKISHGKFPDAASWDAYYPNLRSIGDQFPDPALLDGENKEIPSQGIPRPKPPRGNMNGLGLKGWDWGPLKELDHEIEDGIITQHAVDQLGEKHDKPFFLACGWRKPHLPWYAPQKYFDMYDPKNLTMPRIKEDDEDDLPAEAKKYCYNEPYMAITKAGIEREGVHAYLANISFIDAQVGHILDALDTSPYAKNTIIVFLGDHGWQLGEKHHWSKATLWQESTRAPLMISAPGISPARIKNPVSFLDIYPTLVDLAGLPANAKIEGRSFAPLMKNPALKWDRAALTTHLKGNHSVRTDRWRYTHYRDGGEELYDHSKDEMEWTNLAGDPEYKDVIERLKKWLPKNEIKEEVHVLKWPEEKRKYWEATLKAAERYHGKSIYPKNWNDAAVW